MAVDAELDGDTLSVAFSDGHRCRLSVAALMQRLGWVADPEAPPAPIAWAPARPFPPSPGRRSPETSTNPASPRPPSTSPTARRSFVIIRNTPTTEGTVAEVAAIGYIAGNNFGWVFDVRRTKADRSRLPDRAEAPHRPAHRKVQPRLQLLHCLANEEGGDSVLVDGLAATEAMHRNSPTSTRRSHHRGRLPLRHGHRRGDRPTPSGPTARPASSVSSAGKARLPGSGRRRRSRCLVRRSPWLAAGWTILPIRLPSVLVEAI